jgi:hypothetical protein
VCRDDRVTALMYQRRLVASCLIHLPQAPSSRRITLLIVHGRVGFSTYHVPDTQCDWQFRFLPPGWEWSADVRWFDWRPVHSTTPVAVSLALSFPALVAM